MQLRYGATNIVPPGTTLCNVAHCAGLKIPNNVITAEPTPPLTIPQVPQPAPTQQKQPPPNHNQHNHQEDSTIDTVRKTTLQEDTQPHLQYDQEVLTNSIFVSTNEVKFGMTDDPTRRRPDIFVTPCLDVPPGLPDSTTAVQETCTTPSNLTTSNFPRRH